MGVQQIQTVAVNRVSERGVDQRMSVDAKLFDQSEINIDTGDQIREKAVLILEALDDNMDSKVATKESVREISSAIKNDWSAKIHQNKQQSQKERVQKFNRQGSGRLN
jgi:hypothetical protein